MRWLIFLFAGAAALGAGLEAYPGQPSEAVGPGTERRDPPATPPPTGAEGLLARLQEGLPFPIPNRLPPGTLTYRDDICRVTDLVMVATVVARHEYVEERGRIRTPRARVRLFAERVIRGETPPHMDIVVTGGKLGQLEHPGSGPELAVGQRYLLLLRKHVKWGWRILGGGEGAVRVPEEASLPGNAQMEMMWEQACAVPLPVPQRTFAEDR